MGGLTGSGVTAAAVTSALVTNDRVTGPAGGVTPIVDGQGITDYSRCEFETNPTGVSGGIWIDTWWSPDGTKVYVARDSTNQIEQDNVDPAYSLLAADWTGFGQIAFTDPRAIWWTPDGSRVFLLQGSGQLFQSDASVAFDLTSLTGAGNRFLSSGQLDIYFSQDGLTIWVYSSANPTNSIRELALTSAYDVTTINLTAVRTKSFVGDFTNANAFVFSDDGAFLYLITPTLGGSAGQLSSYALSTPFDIDTAGPFTQGPAIVPTSRMSIPRGLCYRHTDGALFVNGDQGVGNQRVQFYCPNSTPDIDQFTFNGEIDTAGMDVDLDSYEDMWVGPDGENLYTCRGTTAVEDAFWFEMSIAHDITTLTFTEKNNADGQPPRGIALSEDGDNFYIYYRNPSNPDAVFRWPLSTVWDIDTKGSRTDTAALADFSNAPNGLWFKPDGTMMYLMDNIDDTVYSYNLPTPWSFTGMTVGPTFDYSTNTTSSTNLTLSSDGTRMYLTNNNNQTIDQYNLGVPFDVSEAFFSGKTLSLPGGSGGTNVRGVAIRDNFLYVCYQDNEFIEQFIAP